MFKKSVWFDVPDDVGGSASGGTPDAGSVPDGTPSPGTADAGLEKQKFEEMLKQRDQDINRLKSTLQTQLSQQQRKWEEERQQLMEDLRKAQMASLDDDERKEFQRNLETERAIETKQRLQQREQELEELRAAQNYRDYFVAQGVPADKLVTDQGLDVLVQSGWQGIQAIMTDMRTRLQQFEAQAPAQQTPQSSPTSNPRTPISAGNAPAGAGPTWNDLIAKYGSQEEVYLKVEMGELPPSIIPTQ